MSEEEKEAVAEAAIQQVAGRVPILVSFSNLTTEHTRYHARFAEAAGATAAALICRRLY